MLVLVCGAQYGLREGFVVQGRMACCLDIFGVFLCGIIITSQPFCRTVRYDYLRMLKGWQLRLICKFAAQVSKKYSIVEVCQHFLAWKEIFSSKGSVLGIISEAS